MVFTAFYQTSKMKVWTVWFREKFGWGERVSPAVLPWTKRSTNYFYHRMAFHVSCLKRHLWQLLVHVSLYVPESEGTPQVIFSEQRLGLIITKLTLIAQTWRLRWNSVRLGSYVEEKGRHTTSNHAFKTSMNKQNYNIKLS